MLEGYQSAQWRDSIDRYVAAEVEDTRAAFLRRPCCDAALQDVGTAGFRNRVAQSRSIMSQSVDSRLIPGKSRVIDAVLESRMLVEVYESMVYATSIQRPKPTPSEIA